MLLVKPSTEARRVLELGREHHMRFRLMEERGMIDTPVYKDEWVYEPADFNYIPEDAKTRADLILKSNIGVQGFVVAHEAPRLLGAPESKPAKVPEIDVMPVVEKILSAFITVATGFVYALGYMLVIGLALDPALIVVLDDGTRIELMTWIE